MVSETMLYEESNEELALSKTLSYHDKKMIVNKERMRIDKISRAERAAAITLS